MRRAVVVTGVGAVGPWGCGTEPLARALRDGASLATPVGREAGPGGARTAALVPAEIDLAEWLPGRSSRRMSPPSRHAVAAARMACRSAGLTDAGGDAAVCLATTFGPTSSTENILCQILDEGPEAVSPMLFSECVANAPASQVALACGARGPNVMIVQREAGSCLAASRGATLVGQGKVGRALVGVVDELTPFAHAVLDRFHALARPRGGEEVARPFDMRRDGFVAAEGATVWLLETEAAARERRAPMLARVRAVVGAADPTAPAHDWGTGHGALAARLRRALARVDVAPDSIDLVVSSASGSRRGDAVEALTLRAVFGERMPPVLAPKGITGEYGGGQMAAVLLAIAGAPMRRPPGFASPDPRLGVVPASLDGAPPRRLLVSALAAGGAAAWMVLDALG